MKKLKTIIHSIMLATTSSIFAYPQNNLPQITPHVVNCGYSQKTQEWVRPTTYDGIIQLLEDLESGELEKKHSPTQLARVNDYLVQLANEGILPNEFNEEAVLEEDIEDLLYGKDNAFELAHYLKNSKDFMIIPAVLNGYSDYNIVQCGSISKSWNKTKKFAKKYKKELVIGAVVVVAVAAVTVAVVVVSSASAVSALAGAAGAAGTAASSSNSSSSDTSQSDSNKSESSKSSVSAPNDLETPTPSKDIAIFKSAMEDQISSFKKNLAQENFFKRSTTGQSLSLEETGRAVGPLFAHDSFNHLNDYLSNYPQFSEEVQSIAGQYNFSLPPGVSNNPIDFGRNEIDKRFSSDYGPFFSNPGKEVNFNSLSYQMRGEKALDFGYYKQAVNDLSIAIELNPINSIPYLERSEAHFRLGNYDRCLDDFHTFTEQATQESKILPLSVPEFSLGFAKGLPKGMYESGHGILLLFSDIVFHPIHTGEQMWSSLKLLSDLAGSKEWGVLSEVLAPEVHQLVTQWDTIPSDVRGELAGHAFGKYGADIIIPGALAKAVSRGSRGAQELSTISRSLRTAERTFLMESVSSLESGAQIAEVIQLESRISRWLGEGARFIRNEAGDTVFLSKDGLKCVRFDFNRTKPHNNPHAHVEVKVDGKWVKSGQIYPIDVPHN